MIRPFLRQDTAAVMDLWLRANLEAHAFVPQSCWLEAEPQVRQAIAQAEVYVWEEGGLQGFLGLSGDYVAGLFVRAEARSRGVGRLLLERAKAGRERLSLDVYQKNEGAVRFYLREGFSVLETRREESTGETEYRMAWRRRDGCV